MIKVITVTSQPERAKPLTDSLTKFGWDWVMAEVEWRGFGTKLIATYDYLKKHPEITDFIFADAHDVVALAGPDEFGRKVRVTDTMILSTERGLWPPTLIPFRSKYSEFEHGFNYINSGLYYSRAQEFIELYEKYTPFYEIDDQIWLNLCFLFLDERNYNIRPDYNQEIFNSHSFIRDQEYEYENGRSYNTITKSSGVFLHGNGGGLPQQVYDLLK